MKDLYVYIGIANEIDADPNQTYYCLNDDKTGYDEYTGDFSKTDETFIYVLSSLVVDGNILEIPPLEFLRRKNTIDNIGSAAALTGTITINVNANANEFNLFQKYSEIYPGVKIQYGDKVNLTEAFSIEFYGTEEYATGLSPYASYLSNGEMTWAQITEDLTDPAKSDNYYIYTFTGSWKEVIVGDDNTITYGEIFDLKNNNNTVPPNRDLKLIPVFAKEIRLWDVEFYDDKGNKIPSLCDALPYDAKNENGKTKTIADHLSNKPLYFHYKDDRDLPEDERYEL
jgi:hypothetical protein